jgi:hypothetical protein
MDVFLISKIIKNILDEGGSRLLFHVFEWMAWLVQMHCSGLIWTSRRMVLVCFDSKEPEKSRKGEKMKRNYKFGKNGLRLFGVLLLFVLGFSTPAFAASDYSGTIGRIDVRSGYASTSSYKHGLVIRNSSSGVVCVMNPGSENFDQILSIATAAMLSGRTVLIKRGGALDGQYKCYQIQVND